MTWLLSALGAALIAVALRDIYATLWHPHGLGTLSRWVSESSGRSPGGSAATVGRSAPPARWA